MLFRRLSNYVFIIVLLFGAFGCHQGGEEGLPPEVALQGDRIFRLELGSDLTIAPSFFHLTQQTTIRWILDDQTVGSAETYTFTADQAGVHYLTVEGTTGFVTAFLEVSIEVLDNTPGPEPPQPPADSARVSFERSEYHVALGRTIRLLPLDIDSTKTYTFIWQRDGAVVQQGDDPLYRFEALSQGRFPVEFRMELDGQTVASHSLMVVVCPAEGAFRRPAAPGNAARCNKVFDFTPAPGQYVNENYTAETMEAACDYALGRMKEGNYVSLGGFGGYIVVGFDHSIASSGGYDFAVKNSIYTNYSEPGIVWVMQDEDGNGLPDDTWYELRGSCDEDSVGKLTFGYELTYTRQSMDDTPWEDNRGATGVVPRNGYHEDNEYFPLWVGTEQLTFSGTRLPGNGYVRPVTGYYFLKQFAWGYVDNQPNTKEDLCSFDLDWAVDPLTRQSVSLDCIHFVRVYTGLNQVGDNGVGETSTEVSGARDLHLDESVAYMEITSALRGVNSRRNGASALYDLQGRSVVSMPGKGLYIKDGKKIILK